MNRIFITGLGVTSPIGCGLQSFWTNLKAGKSGIGPVTLFDTSAMPVKIGGQVREFDEQKVLYKFPAACNERDRKIWLALDAADQAVSNAGLEMSVLQEASLHVGVGLEAFVLGDITPFAAEPDLAAALSEAMREGNVPFLQTPLDRIADILGCQWGLWGGRWANCSACAAGGQVIGEAFHWLRDGGGNIALVGATDSMLNPLGLGGFSLLRVLSDENENPQQACRPFDSSRKGTVLGEGAAFLILETEEHARARNAKIFAEVLGYGSSMDAHRVSDPDPSGQGAQLSMGNALHDAGLTCDQIDCVNAHGTGTPKNDVVETAAIKETLGSRAYEVPVHAVKSMTGHLIAASGAVEAIAAALTLSEQTVPPTINLHNPDLECDLDYVAEGARPFAGRTVLSNSFGFGGQNATLIFGRAE